MRTLGRSTRNGKKKATTARIDRGERPHPAIAKLAAALKAHKEALERQTATAEILKVISRSPNDVQPVFDAIAKNARRLLGAFSASVTRRVGDALHLAAVTTISEAANAALKRRFPVSLSDTSRQSVKAAFTKAPAYTTDTEGPEAPPETRELGRVRGYRSSLAVPMLLKEEAIGTIAITRREPGAFSKHDIELLQAFADQAVIAIENVRLFNETKEALEHQKASSDILRIVASSVESTDPVFKAITEAGMRLVPDSRVGLLLVRDSSLHHASHSGIPPDQLAHLEKHFPAPLDRQTIAGSSILDRRVIQVADIAEVGERYPHSLKAARASGDRSLLVVPLLHGERAVGSLSIRRPKAGTFTEKQIELAKTFADQAVIAIENSRLFNETKEALEHQKAAAEVLRIVAGSVENTDPVFEAITAAGMRLVPGARVSLTIVRDGEVHYVSHSGVSAAQRAGVAQLFPLALDGPCTVATTTIIEKRVVHLPDIEVAGKELELSKKIARESGYRAILSAPLMREAQAIGTIAVSREQPGPFTDKQIELIKTFADQAVIAIQNAKMFREIQDRNAELKQALDFQSASGEILSSISSSITDAQPVFDAIVRSLLRLFGTSFATVALLRDGQLQLTALQGEKGYEWLKETYPQPLSDWNLTGRAILSGKVLQLTPCIGNPATPPRTAEVASRVGFNSIIAAPMIREGKVIGSITTAHRDAVPFDDRQVALIKAFADQAVIAIENARLFNETKEALEQQTATAEILRVISSSPADIRPVFDSILEHAMRLCDAKLGSAGLYDGKLYQHIAQRGGSPEYVKFLFRGPFEPGPGTGRMIAERKPFHVADYREVESYRERDPRSVTTVDVGGTRTYLAVPLLKEQRVIGGLVLRRAEVRPFTEKQIGLVSTFANQAVIAIENARLFNETKEALEQQTAISEVLRVISDSPTDVKPVLDAVAVRAARICEASDARIFLVEGDHFRHAAGFGDMPVTIETFPLNRETPSGRAVIDGIPQQVEDIAAAPMEDFGLARENAQRTGSRTILSVPLLREERALGTIALRRREVRPFTEKQIALLQTFADQAAIAIENVRLFNETKEALEQQTASSEVLEVISKSPSDLRPVFDAILASATRLCDAHLGLLNLSDGETYRTVAERGASPAFSKWVAERGSFKPHPLTAAVRAVEDREPIQVPDIRESPAFRAGDVQVVKFAELAGARTYLMVPLLKDDGVLGTIAIYRPEVRAFSDKQIELVKTFANQAVIAIENVRLFNETKESLERQTATAEILRVIAGSPSEVQPVFDTICASAARLCDAKDAVLWRVDGEALRVGSHFGELGVDELPLGRDSAPGLAALDNEVVHVLDLQSEQARFPLGSEIARRLGLRTTVSVPLVREGNVIGVITARRAEIQRFTDKQVSLLKTFADQAVIAIENVRLFNETKEALERQTATAEILKVISSSPTDVQPVFDAIVESAARLFGRKSRIRIVEDGELRLRARSGRPAPGGPDDVPLAINRESTGGRVALERIAMQIGDTHAPDAPPLAREFGEKGGYRAIAAAPLLREGAVVGVISVNSPRPGALSDKQMALLQTFADQAVIAIENVRLFNETKEALERQTATAEILRVISSTPTDTQPVFEAIVEATRRLVRGKRVGLFVRDGSHYLMVANTGLRSDQRGQKVPLDRERNFPSRAILDAEVVHVEDWEGEDVPEFEKNIARTRGIKSGVIVPLLRKSEGIGALLVVRETSGRFDDKEIALLQSFADQAVIAIENVRLFNETKEALERQTATSEILKVISASPTATQPVFEAIVQSAAHLFAPCNAVLVMREGDLLERKARAGTPEHVDQAALARIWPLPFDPERSVAARCIVERRIIEIPDTEAPGLPAIVGSLAKAARYRAITLVPLIREGEGIGLIALNRPEPGFTLTEKQLALVRTFADQAVIAIENVRLFKELKARTKALTKSVNQLTALGEVGQAISSTLDLEVVLKTIVSHALQLTGLDAGAIYEYDEHAEEFHLRAAENLSEEIIEILRKRPIKKGDGAVGGTAVAREPIQVPETQDESYKSELRDLIIRTGRRALLAVPLMREDHIIGALAVQRNTPGPFAPEVVELLKTFATQSAMAIQNARLYREIEQKSRELEAASKHKSHFLASMSHELRTPLNAILGFNEMILDQVYGEVPPDVKAPLENIQSSGRHLLRLINNVLDLAKIEAGRMELALSDFSVQDTVASVHSTLKPLAAEKGLEFVAEVPADIPPAHGDAGRVAQCLMNLAGNSLKFTKQGRVAIAVARDDGLLRFSVADTGIGIPPEKIDSLFTEFRQTDATIASEYGGTGLGLSITKKFIEMHGGRIWVESELGKGSTFRFEIPLRVAAR